MRTKVLRAVLISLLTVFGVVGVVDEAAARPYSLPYGCDWELAPYSPECSQPRHQ
jgi:hypothetical protein